MRVSIYAYVIHKLLGKTFHWQFMNDIIRANYNCILLL